MRKIILLSIALVTLVVTYSQSLDPSFAGKGYTETDFASGNFYFETSPQVVQKGDGTYFVLYGVNGYTVLSHHFANGDRDPNFGTAGYSQSIDFNDAKMVLQSDGRLIVAGQKFESKTRTYDFGLVRYNTDGFIDKTFAGDGLQTVDFFNDDDLAEALAIQPDGKIVVGGWAYSPVTGMSDFALARFKTDGTLDASFDGDGKATTDFGSNDAIRAISIQPNGKIAAVGESYNQELGYSRIAVARYNSNGMIDKSFSGDGKEITDFPGLDSYAYGVAVQTDGKIVLTGQVGEWYIVNSSIALIRYNTNGSLDNSFGGNGKLLVNFSDSTDVATTLALQPDGKIVIGGYSYNPKTQNEDIVVARFNTNGTPDNTFGKNGKTVTDFDGGYEEPYALLIQPDGKIVVSGEVFNTKADNMDYAIIRYNENGSLDRKFGHKGFATGYFEAADTRMNTEAIQADGKIVVAGETFVGGKTFIDFALARYNPNGTLDKTFGKEGKVTTDFLGDFDDIISVAIQPDGKIVAAGIATDPTTFTNDFALARYNPDGSLDKKFGQKGKVTIKLSDDYNYFGDMVLQGDGKIIMVGALYNKAREGDDFLILRYTADGLPDNTFDGDGKVLTQFSLSEAFATSVVIQPNGKIVASGYGFTTTSYLALARYNTNGSLDASFDGDGKVVTGFGNDVYGSDMALQADGKIVVAGEYYNFSTNKSDFALARYKTDGSLDKSFDSDGRQVTDLGGENNSGVALAIQSDGKILLLGTALNNSTGVADMSLTRYNTDGYLDKSFDSDGTLISHLFGYDNIPSDILIRNNKAFITGYTYTPGQSSFLASYLLGSAVPQVNEAAAGLVTAKETALQFSVRAQPNPSANYFLLVLKSEKNTRATIKVSDASGRLVEAKTNVASNTTTQLGQSYRPGIYFAEIIQGNKRTVVKLVKQ